MGSRSLLTLCVGILIGFGSPAFAQNKCGEAFRASEAGSSEQETFRQKALEIRGQIERLEKHVKVLSYFSGKDERTTRLKIRANLDKMMSHIFHGEVYKVTDMYRNLFRDVELAMVLIEQNRQRLRDPDLGVAERLRLEKQTDRQLKLFGEGYPEYMLVRQRLELIQRDGLEVFGSEKPLADTGENFDAVKSRNTPGGPYQGPSDKEVRASADYVLNSMGMKDLDSSLPALAIPDVRPSADDVKAFFNHSDNIKAKIAKLRKDRKEEFWSAAKTFVLDFSLYSGFRKVVHRLVPAKMRGPVSELLLVGYDIYVRDNHLPEIDSLLDMKGTITERLDKLLAMNAKYGKDELLVTMARVTEKRGLWRQLVTEAKIRAGATETSASKVEANLYERFQRAEKEAVALGDLSSFYNTSPSRRLAILSWWAMVGSRYVVEHHWQEVAPVIDGLRAVVGL